MGAALPCVRRAGERDVSFAGQQPGSGIEANPAGAGEIDLGPCVQIGKVGGGAGGAFERLHVGGELNQVAGDETGRQSQVAQDLHQQPGRVAAGTGAQGERLLAALHPVLQADDVADVALHPLIEADQKINVGVLTRGTWDRKAASLGPGVSASRKGRSSRAREFS